MVLFMLSSSFNSILALGLSTYTAELYPTEMRALGVGIGNAWVRFAAIVGPISVGWAVPHIGLNAAYAVFAIFAIIGGLTVIFVAVETRGKVLEVLSPSLEPGEPITPTPKPQTGAAE
jgi:putative MFS transporter